MSNLFKLYNKGHKRFQSISHRRHLLKNIHKVSSEPSQFVQLEKRRMTRDERLTVFV